ncbi:MAG TPA: hypothetical protein VFH68_06190 [Polyangia bacterium]|nr:hypothetical protein [Polyangia bacterium]
MLRAVQPQLDDLRACYVREKQKNPKLAAGGVVVHVIVDPAGKVIQASAYDANSKDVGSFEVIRRDVGRCLGKRLQSLELPLFPDGMARKIVVAFRFGTDGPPTGLGSKEGVSSTEVRFGRAVVAGESVGFSRSLNQLTHRYCWKEEADREGCSLRVLALFPSRSLKKEIPILKPGEVVKEGERSSKESRLLLELSGNDSIHWPPGTELAPVEWPDDAAALVLPDIGVALSAAGGRIDVARAGPDGEEIPATRLDLHGGRAAHLVAVYWAPSVPVVAIGTRRPAAPGMGDPAAAKHVTDVETIPLEQ